MKNVKKVECGGFYLLKGIASANSLFFEDRSEKLYFQKLGNNLLESVMEIREYCLTAEGWMIVVKLKDKRTIKKHFDILKANSPSKGERFVKIWEMISELVRMWLNRYSKWVNRKRVRIGSLVGGVYERYYFDTGEEAIKKIEEMRNQKIESSQITERFRANMRYYKKREFSGKNEWIKTSGMVQRGEKLVQEIGFECLYLWELSLIVASKMVDFTKNLHVPKNSSKSSAAPS